MSEQPAQVLTVGIRDVVFGDHVTVVDPVNLYGCAIGDDSFIGPFVEIQSGARIGRCVRVQSHVFICDLVTIGDDCFIGHGVTFTNDPLSTGGPARGDRANYRPTTLGQRVSVGSGATLLPVAVCDDVVIGAGSVVTHDITEPGIYAGNPARRLRSVH